MLLEILVVTVWVVVIVWLGLLILRAIIRFLRS